MEFVSMEDLIQNSISLTRQRKNKINGVRKNGGYDSKHDITYNLRKEKNKWGS